MIPKGNFQAKTAGEAQLAETKTGKEQIVVPLELLDGEAKGSRITYYGGFWTDKTTTQTLKALRVMGWKGDDLANVGPLPETFEVVIDHEEYNGKTLAKVKYVNPLAGPLKGAMDAAKAVAFAAKMKARAAASAVAATAAPATDEELPF